MNFFRQAALRYDRLLHRRRARRAARRRLDHRRGQGGGMGGSFAAEAHDKPASRGKLEGEGTLESLHSVAQSRRDPVGRDEIERLAVA